MYVTYGKDPRIAVVDSDNPSNIVYIDSGVDNPYDIAIQGSSNLALVANTTDSVLAIDLTSNRLIGQAPVGHQTYGIVYSRLPSVLAYVAGPGGVTAILELPELP